MRSNYMRVFALAAVLTAAHPCIALAAVVVRDLLVLPPAPTVTRSEDIKIEHVTVPQRVQPGSDDYRIYVRLGGDLPPQAILEDVASWHLTARLREQGPAAIPLTSASWSPITKRVTLIFRRPGLDDPTSYKWKVLFTGGDLNVVGAPAGGGGTAGWESAKGKDDADLYASGRWLAGRGSAPIFALDAKYSWAEEVGATPWDIGLLAQASVNSDAEIPTETSTFDLDAISAAFAARYYVPNTNLVLDLQPVRGEFTKTLSTGDVVGAVRMTALVPPFGSAAIRPYVGAELGVPITKPDSLYGQAVDLGRWKRAERLVGGVSAVFYVFQPKVTPDNVYRFSVDLSLNARKPLSDEPYVTTERVAGKLTPVVHLRKNVRPEAEGALTWNISQFIGLQAQYKYGSLPPVFKLADHQITIGLTLKAKRAGARPAMF